MKFFTRIKEKRGSDIEGQTNGGGIIQLRNQLSTAHQNLNDPKKIFKYAKDGDEKKFIRLIEERTKNLDINMVDEKKCTALHYAARYSHVEIVKYLFERGANTQLKNSDDMTPFLFACRYGRYDWRRAKNVTALQECSLSPDGHTSIIEDKIISPGLQVINLFLEKDSYLVKAKDKYGMTGLHHAAIRGNNDDVIAVLLKKDKELLDKLDNQGNSALHLAATHGQVDTVVTLLQAGALIKFEGNRQNQNILHTAIQGGHIKVINFLTSRKADFKKLSQSKDDKGSNVLHMAVETGSLKMVEILLEQRLHDMIGEKNYEEELPLHLATRTGNIEMIKLLLNNSKELNNKISFIDRKNLMGETCLHLAARNGHHEVAEEFIKKGANHKVKDASHLTPWMLAALNQKTQALDVFFKHDKVDYSNVDDNDRNIFHLLAQRGLFQIIKFLMSKPDFKELIKQRDQFENVPLHVATEEGNLKCMELLVIENKVDYKNEEQRTPCHIAASKGHVEALKMIIEKDKYVINNRDEDGNTPLHCAAYYNQSDCLSFLLQRGAKTEDQNKKSYTPLHCAAESGSVSCVELLLNHGTVVDPQKKKKRTTPLLLAAEHGHEKVVKLLMEKGGSITIENDDNKNALQVAIDHDNSAVIETILENPNWKAALRTCFVDKDKGGAMYPNTPMRQLIEKFPDMAIKVFDKCVNRITDEKSDESSDGKVDKVDKVELDFEFIDDAYNFEAVKNDTKHFKYAQIKSDGSVLQFKSAYHKNAAVRMNHHPLRIMVKEKRHKLLQHPLCIGLIRHKWKTFGKFGFLLQLVIYLAYLVSVTIYSQLIITSESLEAKIGGYNVTTEITTEASTTTNPFFSTVSSIPLEQKSALELWLKAFVYVFSIVGLIYEFSQFYRMKWRYFGTGNIADICIYVFPMILISEVYSPMPSWSACQEQKCWRWPGWAMLMTAAWLNLLGFLRWFSSFGSFLSMFYDIFKSVLQLMMLVFVFLVAFSFGFNILLAVDQEEMFGSYWNTMLKTAVMATGEFDFGDLYSEDLTFPGAVVALFIAFLLVMAIVLVNLIIGVAVNNIKEIQENAILKKFSTQVESVLEFEKAQIMPKPPTLKIIIWDKDQDLKGFMKFLKSIWNKLSVFEFAGDHKTEEKAAETSIRDEIKQIMETMTLLQTEISKLKNGQGNSNPMLASIVTKSNINNRNWLSRLNKNESSTREDTNTSLLIKEIKSLKEEFRNQFTNLEEKVVGNNWQSFGD